MSILSDLIPPRGPIRILALSNLLGLACLLLGGAAARVL